MVRTADRSNGRSSIFASASSVRQVVDNNGSVIGGIVEIDLFEACLLLGIPEAAAAWDASDLAGQAMADLRGRAIRLYYGKRERWIDGDRVDDILIRMCVGIEQTVADDKHHRFEWSRSRGWIDINELEAKVMDRAAAAAAEHESVTLAGDER